MRDLKPSIQTAVLSLAAACGAHAQDPAQAPLPAQLASAARLFIGNAGDQENGDCLRAYNNFYAGLSGLGRFQLVLAPGDADLVLELHYEIDLGQSIASNDSRKSVRQFRVVLEDPRTRIVLWSLTERTNYALLQSNRNRNLDETVGKLVADVNSLLAPQPAPPANKSRNPHPLI